MAHRDQTVQEILFFFGVGLMNNTLVAVAGGTGLIGVNSRNQDQAVGYLVVDFCKTVDIIADRILVIYEGRIVADLDPKTVTVQELGLYMAGSGRRAVQ